MKHYVEAKGKGCNNIKVEVYYSLGGYNYFNYKNENRGYYLSVTPVERNVRNGYTTESYTLGNGLKYLLKEVKRQSKKAEEEAESLAKEIEASLVKAVCDKYGIELM